MAARLFNVVVGTWLIVSGFAWPHDVRMFKATVACGLLTIVLSVASIFAHRPARWVTGLVSVILVFLSAVRVSRHDPVFWNNVIVALVISLTAFLGTRQEPAFAG
jgi:uncharacterized membrane protein